ncbi:Threonylcarbamoyl-AMP synthase [Trichinella spiralis]|uniref:Threonylcarbamoyl-AMP synthase n=1 Tax=Trichinella spiralis TaxID=6334 RepID=A0ABR3KR28_TRISP
MVILGILMLTMNEPMKCLNCQKRSDRVYFESMQKLYEVKRRQPNKPIAFCLADVCDIALYADVDIPAELLNRLLPE